MTYIVLRHIVGSNGLALIAELIEEEEPPEAVLADEDGEAEEGEGGDGGEGELHHGVVGAGVAGVAVGAGEEEVRRGGDGDGEEEEQGPRERGGEGVGLVHAHPPDVGAERVELVVQVGDAAVVLATAI